MLKSKLCGKLLIAIGICLCMISCQAKTISGKVVKVSDGDTFIVVQNKREYKIRLDGVDCPEARQAYGKRAKQFTSAQIYNRQVRVSYKKKDQYGRYLGTVYYGGGKNLNHEILKAGMAWHYKHYNQDKTLSNLETMARNKRVGLWADRQPVPPWIFRRYKS
ncbi:MAG: thermonuclease family protein [Candidatus Cloacimonetes bacterium]|nr:thermonuclease family protein [Candidatus Cloacimonadota bacterium]